MNKVEMSGKSGLAAVLEFSCCSHGPIVISVLSREEPGIERKTRGQPALPLTCSPQTGMVLEVGPPFSGPLRVQGLAKAA